VDRVGGARLVIGGLIGTTGCFLILATNLHPWPAYAAVVVAMMPLVFVVYVPASSMLATVSDRTSWSLPFAVALSAVGWGIGETAGALATGASLESWGAAATAVGGAGVSAVSAVVSWALARRWATFPGLTRPIRPAGEALSRTP
jgi:predicted MFS family arabinose efflux permease